MLTNPFLAYVAYWLHCTRFDYVAKANMKMWANVRAKRKTTTGVTSHASYHTYKHRNSDTITITFVKWEFKRSSSIKQHSLVPRANTCTLYSKHTEKFAEKLYRTVDCRMSCGDKLSNFLCKLIQMCTFCICDTSAHTYTFQSISFSFKFVFHVAGKIKRKQK